MRAAEGPERVEYRRASSDDAFALAGELFDHGQRVDMQTLAERLGVGRTTLYRWVGDRERLNGTVVVRRIGGTWQRARGAARGRAGERTLDSVRLFIDGVLADRALRGFVEREPRLALRVLLDPDGLVAAALAAGLSAAAVEDGAGVLEQRVVATLVQLSTALVWANVAGGIEPRSDAVIDVMRAVMRS